MIPLQWRCHICGETRPDAQIFVRTTDFSAEYNFEPGTFKQNVRYCNDKPSCIADFMNYRILKPKAKS